MAHLVYIWILYSYKTTPTLSFGSSNQHCYGFSKEVLAIHSQPQYDPGRSCFYLEAMNMENF